MSLQRSDNEYLRAFTPHAQSDQLEREGLTCAACSKKYHIILAFMEYRCN